MLNCFDVWQTDGQTSCDVRVRAKHTNRADNCQCQHIILGDACCRARYTLATKSKGRSTFGRQKSPTFDKVDRVEHVQLWRQCRPRQAVEFDFVASVYGRTGGRATVQSKLLWPAQHPIVYPLTDCVDRLRRRRFLAAATATIVDKKFSCRRETAQRFVSLNILLNHSSHSEWHCCVA